MLPTIFVQVFQMQEALSMLISWSILTITGPKRLKDTKTDVLAVASAAEPQHQLYQIKTQGISTDEKY